MKDKEPDNNGHDTLPDDFPDRATGTQPGGEAGETGAAATEPADAAPKRQRSEREERARRAFKQLTDIDDEDDDTGGNLSLRGILGGDILGSARFRRQMWYILFVCVLAIIYISNRYACQRMEIRREELNRELADRKFKALTISAELTEFSMRNNIEGNLPDSTLGTSTNASYYLPIDPADSAGGEAQAD